MDKKRWNIINEILDTVLELEEGTRENYVLSVCEDDPEMADEIIGLLKQEAESEVFWKQETQLSEKLLKDFSQTLTKKSGSENFEPFTIGRYKATEILGRGGMGTVYKAQRTDGEFERFVAVKVVNEHFISEGVIDRFRKERQILARLSHPNIASLYDGGITEDGRPYLVMELIEGTTITDYCTEHNLGLPGRIELIKKMCLAIHHAHQNLVVHRDLKPSNILADHQGNLKILDFGIAKLIEENPDHDFEQTAASLRLMSLQYASPEQADDGPITTASDIYNIGLIAYELIFGRPAFDLTDLKRSEAEKVILEKIPGKPTEGIAFDIKPDLEAIIFKALRKEPEARYSSASEFYQDLENYQASLPVRAVGEELGYKVKRFFSRNIKPVTAAALFLLTVISLLVYHINTVSIERDRAIEEAEKARITSAFMAGIFENADYTRDDEVQITSNKFLNDGVEYIHHELGRYPDVQARLLETVAEIKQNLGQLDEAEQLYLEVLEIRKHLREDHDDKYLVASSYHNLGTVYQDKGEYPKAESYFLQALRLKENSPSGRVTISSASNTWNELGWIWYIQGKYPEADSILSLSKARLEQEQLNETALYSSTLQSLAWVHFELGNYEKSDSLFRQTLSLRRALYETGSQGAFSKDIAQTLHSLGWLLYTRGALNEAARFTEEAVVIRDSTYERNHAETAWSLNNLGLIEQSRGNLNKADSLILEAYQIRKEKLGETHPHTIQSLGNLAIIQYRKGNYDEAVSSFKEVLGLNQKVYEAPHTVLVNDLGNLGAALMAAGELREAYKTLNQAYEMGLVVYPDDHAVLARTLERMAELEGRLGIRE